MRRQVLHLSVGQGRPGGFRQVLCPMNSRRGPWRPAGTHTHDPEQVTCLKCLDILTRPVKS